MSGAELSGTRAAVLRAGLRDRVQSRLDRSRDTPSSGATIGFDAGVDVRQSADSPLKLQSIAGYRAQVSSPSCGGGAGQPSCDDRTWCQPKLE